MWLLAVVIYRPWLYSSRTLLILCGLGDLVIMQLMSLCCGLLIV